MTHSIRLEHQNGGEVARLILASPQNLNAMDLAMAEAFRWAREELEKQLPRVIVISAEGRAFSAGGDLKMLRRKSEDSVSVNAEKMIWFYQSFLGLRELEVPLLCALHGHVVGAGFCFAAGCDMRVADETVKLACPFTRLGLHPGMGGSFFLPRALGSETAREMMLTGRRMGGTEAYNRGFLAQLAPEGELEEAIETQLGMVLKGGPEATRALLASQRAECRHALEAALQREAQEQAKCYAGEEFLEGVDALIEKRSPNWG